MSVYLNIVIQQRKRTDAFLWDGSVIGFTESKRRFQTDFAPKWMSVLFWMRLPCLAPLSSTFSQIQDASHSLVVGRVVDSGGSPNAGGAMSPSWTSTASWEQWPLLLPAQVLSALHLFLLGSICICNDSMAGPRWNTEAVYEWNSPTSCSGR